jgi:hypothetical protein
MCDPLNLLLAVHSATTGLEARGREGELCDQQTVCPEIYHSMQSVVAWAEQKKGPHGYLRFLKKPL